MLVVQKSNECKPCSYTSSRAGSFRHHLKTHNREKANKCYMCEFASSYSSILKTHEGKFYVCTCLASLRTETKKPNILDQFKFSLCCSGFGNEFSLFNVAFIIGVNQMRINAKKSQEDLIIIVVLCFLCLRYVPK